MDLGAFDKRDKLNRSPPPVKNGRVTGSQPALTEIPDSGPEPEPASTSSEETQLALSQAMTSGSSHMVPTPIAHEPELDMNNDFLTGATIVSQEVNRQCFTRPSRMRLPCSTSPPMLAEAVQSKATTKP